MPRTSPIWSNKIRRSLFDKNKASSRCLWIHNFKFIFIRIWVCKQLYKDKFRSSVSLPSTMQEHDIYLHRWPNLGTLRDEPLSTQSSMQNVLWQPLKKPDNKSLSLKKTLHKKNNDNKKKLTKVKCQKKNSDNFLVQKTSLPKFSRLSRCVTFLDEVKTAISDLEKFLEGARVNARIVPGHWLRVGMNTESMWWTEALHLRSQQMWIITNKQRLILNKMVLQNP